MTDEQITQALFVAFPDADHAALTCIEYHAALWAARLDYTPAEAQALLDILPRAWNMQTARDILEVAWCICAGVCERCPDALPVEEAVPF